MRLVLGDMDACKDICGEYSHIGAKVDIDGAGYTVRIMFVDGVAKFSVGDVHNENCTGWYLRDVLGVSQTQNHIYIPLDDPNDE